MVESPLTTIGLQDEFVEISSHVMYRGKTNGYWKEENRIDEIVDKTGDQVIGIWNKEWAEPTPGIKTRSHPERIDSYVGEKVVFETHYDRRVRIGLSACPVRVKFVETSEYTDYDDNQYSSHSSHVQWIEYVATRILLPTIPLSDTSN
jgi:hypothetical protein